MDGSLSQCLGRMSQRIDNPLLLKVSNAALSILGQLSADGRCQQ